MRLLKQRLSDFQARHGIHTATQQQQQIMNIYEPSLSQRARPGQQQDALTYAYSTGPNFQQTLAMYAYNNWVMTAVSRLASRAAGAELDVVGRDNPMKDYPNHPLLDLVGVFGKPNDYQDTFEFWELHHTQQDLMGNTYWYFESPYGGLPTSVHLLDPDLMRVVPGTSHGIKEYVYTIQGQEYHLPPETVTHFKRANPYNRYYGMSALEALKVEVISDRSMAAWNAQFFSEDVGVPAGIVVVPPEVPDTELERVADEFNAKHGGRRRTAFLRAPIGGAAYFAAGTTLKDMDFTNGRMLSRKAVYEALELPLGLMSEASTEAHARVAERQLAEAIRIRHVRIQRKLNADVLPFWPMFQSRQTQFEDLSLRSADWDRESKRVSSMKGILTVNEIRQDVFRKPPMKGGEGLTNGNTNDSQQSDNGNPGAAQQPDRGNTDSVQQSG